MVRGYEAERSWHCVWGFGQMCAARETDSGLMRIHSGQSVPCCRHSQCCSDLLQPTGRLAAASAEPLWYVQDDLAAVIRRKCCPMCQNK